MISKRYTHVFSVYNGFHLALAILIGLVFAISCSAYFFRLAIFTVSPYIITCIGALLAYFALTRLIYPVWKVWSTATRYSVIGASVALATAVFFLAPPTPAGSLMWQWSVGPTAGQSANIFPARSWGSAEQQVIELHASENPDAPQPKTTYGIWQATASVSNLLNGASGQLRFYLTQPDWAIIDPKTGQAYQGGDGVTVLFKVEQAGSWHTVQQIYLNLSIQPDQRRWQTVDIDIPAGSEQLAVEVQPGSNSAYDRVWITPGVLWTLPKAAVQLAGGLSIGFMAYLGLLATIWSLQTRPGRYVATYTQSVMRQFGSILTALTCLLLGYLLIWHRGMYLDDYSIRFAAIDETGHWKSIFDQSSNPLYPARLLTWVITPRLAALLPDHELLVRILIALFVGANALLLGWLIYRVIGSRLAGVVGGWLFLMPVFTNVTVWVGAVTYVFSVTAALIFLHTFWSGLVRMRRTVLWLGASIAALTIMLLFGEAHLSVIVMAGLIGIIWILNNLADYKARLTRLLVMMVWPLLTFGCLYVFIFHNPHVVEARGGIATNPSFILERAYGFLRSFFFWTIAPGWGRQTTEGLFLVGLTTISRSWLGLILTSIAVVQVLLTALAWHSEQDEYHVSYKVGLMAIATGALWFVISLTIPLALAQYPIYYESRFAYFPLAGVAVLSAALIWTAAKYLRYPTWTKILVGIAGIALLIATISTVGLAQAYAARNALDRNQVAAVQRAIPAQYLPSSPIFVAVNIDEGLPGDAAAIPVFGAGVFEASWAGCSALREAYQRDDLIILSTNRWLPMKFSYARRPDSPSSSENLVSCGHSSSSQGAGPAFPPPSSPMALYVKDAYVPLDKAVLFTYQDGKAAAIETLTMKDADGSQRVVQLPVGQMLRLRGMPTVETLVVADQPLN